jgi:flagellar biosynthesis protein FlhG
MKSLHEQNHYEVLEVQRSAEPEQIERAYRVAQSTYKETSLACYSIYDERDIAAFRDRIETAYRVLSDDEARSAYDRSIRSGDPGVDAARDGEQTGWETLSLTGPQPDEDLPGASESFRELESDVEGDDGEFGGATLRRARLRRGIELEAIADVTKVSIGNLRHIEAENYSDLPAAVYVRGFLKAYATTIGLDPNRVAASYMKKLEEAHGGQSRSRFLGRR